ncbi:MAG: hypothetical protein ACOCUS_06585, partial [Polyangiales bacterium]
PYDLERAAETLSPLAAERQSAGGDEERRRAAVQLARAQADLALVAFARRDVDLARAVERSFGGGDRCGVEWEQMRERCMPWLLSSSAAALEQGGTDAGLAALLRALAEDWRAQGGAFFSAIRVGWDEPGVAKTAAATILAGLARTIVGALETADPHKRVEMIAEGFPIECPGVLPQLGDTDAAERATVLAKGKCLPLCPEAVDALAMTPAEQEAQIDVRRCEPESVGMRTPFGRDVTVLNLPAWLLARSVDWLARAHGQIVAAEDALGRTLVDSGFAEAYADGLSRVHLPVPPPERVPVADDYLELPGWPGRAVWEPAPVYVMVRDGEVTLGAAPAVVVEEGRAQIAGTPFPGDAVATTEADDVLRLEGEGPLADAYRAAVDARPEAAGEVEEPAALLLADGGEPARAVVHAAAGLERETEAAVLIAMRGRDRVGVLHIPGAKSITERARDEQAGRRWLLLHLTGDGARLSSEGTALEDPPVDDLEAFREHLHHLRDEYPDVATLQLSVGDGVTHRQMLRVVHVAAGGESAPFEGMRLAPTGMDGEAEQGEGEP